jgi:sugar O-acyltransferase (sialic acid O-acetyltransferase NeuD family)
MTSVNPNSMSPKNVFIYGAGGHGKLVADALLSQNQAIEAFVDDNPALAHSRVMGLPVLSSEWFYRQPSRRDVFVALGVGNNRTRERIAQSCRAAGMQIITVIHPSAVISRSAEIGEGTVILAGVVVNPEARIGAGVILNSGAVVEHEVVLGDYSHVSTNVAIGGNAMLGRFSMLGVGAAMRPGARVGEGSVVGAGAVVIRNIPENVVAVGVPARVLRSLTPELAKAMTFQGRN